MAWHGECWLEGFGLRGWAVADNDDRPLWIELLADGEIMGVTLANLETPQRGGFWLPVPVAALESGSSLAARVANSGHILEPPANDAETARDGGLAGEMFVDRGYTISGWVVDCHDPEKILRVAAFENGREICAILADGARFRPERANGHGFVLHLPMDIEAGVEHTLEIRDGQGRPLPGSPVRIFPFPENAAAWLERQKGAQPLLCDLLRHFENRVGGGASFASYRHWRETFPPDTPGGKIKTRLGIVSENSGKTDLRRQQGVEIKAAGADADVFLFIGQGESLHPRALALMLAAMRDKKASLVYADGENGAGEPLFKPAWDREFFLARDYLGPMLVSAEAMENARHSADYAAARFHAAIAAESLGGICHVPQPLCREMPLANTPGRNAAIGAWLDASFAGSRLELCQSGLNRVHYSLGKMPRVSVIIPTRDHAALLERCLNSLRATAWPDMEIIIVDNGSGEAEALALLEKAEKTPYTRVLRRPGAFNYAALNNGAAREATGSILCFLNNDTEVLSPDWLAEMVARLLAMGEDAGCVGAKLVWPGGLVQHGGVICGIAGLACHAGNQWLADEAGYMDLNQSARRCSAVTAACMLAPRGLFLDMGGFDARNFPVAFNDVDFCMRLGEAGKKIVWTPHAILAHLESASRGREERPAQKKTRGKGDGIFPEKMGRLSGPLL